MAELSTLVATAAASTSWRSTRRIRIWAASVVAVVGVLALQSVWPQFAWAPNLASSMGAAALLGVFFAALVCEYIDSALGMGYGTTLTPLLLLVGFEPLQIVPAVLLSEFVTGLAAGLLHHRDGNVDFLRDRRSRNTALLLIVLSVVGSLAAVSVALRVSKFWLTAIIACIVLAVGLMILLTVRRQLRFRPWQIVTLGGIAAFNKALSGGGYGPLVTGGQVVAGMPSKSAVAITSLAESFTCLVGLSAYLFMDKELYWPLAIPLTAGALLSVPIATLTVRRMPESFLRGGVGIATCMLALLMFVKMFY